MLQLLCSHCNNITMFKILEPWRDWYIIKCLSCGDEVMIGKDVINIKDI